MEGSTSFLNEWRMLFGETPLKLRKHCVCGHLRNSHLRKDWIKVLGEKRRNYTELRQQMESDPRVADFEENLDTNNPLSLNAKSLWCKHFENQALRKTIWKDVDRTFPDLKYFRNENVKRIMANVLFFYSVNSPHTYYLQGMHELLAPILFVLDSDQKAYQDLKDQNILRPNGSDFSEMDFRSLDELNDPTFLEHDAFAMFTQLMSLVRHFYLSDCCHSIYAQSNVVSFKNHIERTPFSESIIGRSSELLRRLEFYHKFLEYRRWLRLLFGREFPLPDLLYLWDVIFAEQQQQRSLLIVDCIFVALLVQIRNLLLCSDYSSCIHCLMRYPPIADIQSFVHYVLHLASPKKFCGSLENVHKAYQVHLALAGNMQPNTPTKQKGKACSTEPTNRSNSPVQSGTKARQLESVLNKIGRQALSSAHQFQFNSMVRKEHKVRERLQKSEPSTDFIGHKNSERTPHSDSNGDKIELMKEQIAQLQSRLNDSDLLKKLCAHNIASLIKELEKIGPFTDEQTKKISEIQEVAVQLCRSVPEQLSNRFMHALPATSTASSTKGDTVEMASEVLGFRPSTPSDAVSRSRLSSKSLNSSNEMIELRFGRKKNF
uniref:Rab-GAP TBC domain-containing protein n=1 Tax=Globodera rostochiensis TaxID=31243 RepID=A0A914HZP5_GLORO